MSNLPDKLIPASEAVSMIKRYHDKHDERSVSGHFEWSILEDYMRMARDKGDELGVLITGLEIYFAQYENDPVHGDQATYVIYPTYAERDGKEVKHVPFEPVMSTRGNIVTIKGLLGNKATTSASISMRSSGGGQDGGLNRSNMSPPR